MSFPVKIFRLFMRPVVRCLFRVRITGLDNCHNASARTLIVANHVSSLDGFFLFLFLPQLPVFAIAPATARLFWVRSFLRWIDTIEIDPLSPLALKGMTKVLKEDKQALIFPEGRVTDTGSLMKIYEGPAMMAAVGDADILPVGIEGLQYSYFSRLNKLVRRSCFPPVTIKFLKPRKIVLQEGLQGHSRRSKAAAIMLRIMREVAYENAYEPVTLYESLIAAMRRHGPNHRIIEDSTNAKLTYRQLLLRASVVGQFIASNSEQGDCVAVMLPSSAASVVVFFAAQSQGRTVAMLNFTTGTRGLVIACETANVKVVYTSRKFILEGGFEAEAHAIEARSKLVYLEDLREQITPLNKLHALFHAYVPKLSYRMRCRGQSREDDSVVLFTSGSEGIPKGVILTHSNIVANRAQIQTLIALTHKDIVLNVLPMFHAFGLLGGTLMPLLDGAKIVCYPSPLHYRVIPELSYQLGATCLFGTNTFLAGYAKHGHPYDFHKIRFVIAGAEKLTEETRRMWSDKFGIRIYEGYGATEASPVVAVNTPMGNKPESVGQLLAMMDYRLEPVEGILEGGRLVVRGPNIMRGYLFHGGDGERYAPSTDHGPGWYDTGDIVTVDEDGFVTIVGRLKRFAKIGGEMISLLQTEELARAASPNAAHAATALPSSRKGEQIILLTENKELDRSKLVPLVNQLGITEMALPKRVLHCESIPLLGSGKIDYLALRELAKELN